MSFPTLAVTGGPFDGAALTIDAQSSEKLLGSGEGCQLRIELPNVAPAHARIVWDSRGVVLSDSGSAVGTFVNGERISADHVLQDGDRLFLGPPGSKESAKIVVQIPVRASSAEAGVADGGGSEPIVLDMAPEPLSIEPAPPQAEPVPAIVFDEPAPHPPVPAAAPPPAAKPPQPPGPSVQAPRPIATPAVAPPRSTAGAHKPEYTSGIPSMAPTERERPAISLPAAEAPPRRAQKVPPPPIQRVALVAAAAALLAGGAFMAYHRLQKPPPVVLSMVPPKVEPGQTITLTGTGFDEAPERNTVRFGKETGEVRAASETEIAVTVPTSLAGHGPGDYPVTVEARQKKSNALFLKVYLLPRIAALEPDVAMPGDEVVAKGQHLAGPSVTVAVGGQAAEVLESQPTAMRFRVPPLTVPQGKAVAVVVKAGADSGKPSSLLVGRLPLVIEVAPARAMAGERIVVKGRGFDQTPGGNVVTIGGRPVLVLSASATELAVSAPAAVLDGQVQAQVVVQAPSGTSSGCCALTIASPSAATYTPRYFAAPVQDHPSHDHAFIATELGPVLLLTGKGDAPSTAERAARVASALNGLLAAGKPVALELRDKPVPGVAVAGSPSLLVSATPEDTAGYAEPWDPSVKGRRPAPRALAVYWTALLQDHLALFGQGQRPFRVLELSPRGRVLSEIYLEASRKAAAGSGVPTRVISSLAPATARALREVALLLPAEGQGTKSAAVEGRWEGTMEHSGAPRAFSVRLRVEGSKLVGSAITQAGGVSMEVPLQDVAYDNGVLRFVLVSGRASLLFEGPIQGSSVAGSIRAAESKEVVGRFTLRYAG